MEFCFARRAVIFGLAGTLVAAAARAKSPRPERVQRAEGRLAEIEAAEKCRLGVAVIDASDGPALLYRADERFPMCSTFKLLAAAAMLQRVDRGEERLDGKIAYGPGDLLDYAPITKKHLAEGGMTLGALCAAAIDYSDNTAGNLILKAIGGPHGYTKFVRSLGDSTTRLDRNEPTLNTAISGDPRDTTTPLAMARDVWKVMFGEALSKPSRERLKTWLIDDKVGDARLRAGLPPSWTIGDKTGSGDHGAANTLAVIWPPGRAPLVAAVYLTESDKPMDARNAVHKEIGALIAETFPASA